MRGSIEDSRAIQRLLMLMLIVTLLVPEDSPMRVGPSSSMRVWMRLDGVWTLSGNRIEIPEGWYLVPPSYVEEDADA